MCPSPDVSRTPVRRPSNPHRALRPTCIAPCPPFTTEPEESQQRYKDPLPGGARSAGTRYGAPAPCLMVAPRTAGLRGCATLPQLRLEPSSPRSVRVLRSRPGSTGAVRLASGRPPVPGGAHPGKASTASEPCGSASSVLGTDIAGTPYPRVPSLLGLLWRCTPAHRLTAHLDVDRNVRKAFLQHKHNRRTMPAPLHALLLPPRRTDASSACRRMG